MFAGSALASGAGVGSDRGAAGAGRPGPADGGGRRRPRTVPARTRSKRAWVCSASRTGPGEAGRLLRAGRALTAAGATGAFLGRRSRVVSALSGAALLAASVATRFGIFAAGVASARDPKYTVRTAAGTARGRGGQRTTSVIGCSPERARSSPMTG